MESLDTPKANDTVMKTNISDIFSAFSHSAGGDDEILRIASQYALQVMPNQIDTLTRLRTFALDYAQYNPDLKPKIEIFIKEYLEIKHFHESGGFIGRIIEALSVKRLIPTDAVKFNVMK